MDSRAHQLATLLRAIDGLHTERALFLADWKNRLENLEAEREKLQNEILSGQMTLLDQGEKTA